MIQQTSQSVSATVLLDFQGLTVKVGTVQNTYKIVNYLPQNKRCNFENVLKTTEGNSDDEEGNSDDEEGNSDDEEGNSDDEEDSEDEKKISEGVIVGAAVGGTVVLSAAAVFLLIIIKKTTA